MRAPSGAQVVLLLAAAAVSVAVVSVPLAATGTWSGTWATLAAVAGAGAAVPALRGADGGGWTWSQAGAWAGLAAVAGLNLRNLSETVETDRDPGLYYLKAQLLTERGTTVAPPNPEVLDTSDLVYERSGLGLYAVPGSDELYTQFLTGPSSLQALGLAGLPVTGAMVVSVLLTLLASLALFELARPVTGTVLAAGASAAAALSLPWVYFGRATYSEPPAAALLLSGALAFALAVRHRRVGLGVLAGLLLGGVFLMRVDAGLAIGPALVGCCVVAARSPARRRVALATGAAAAALAALSAVDARLLTPGYVGDLRSQVETVVTFVAACAVAGLVVLAAGALVGTGPRGQRWWRRIETAAAVALVAGAVLLAFQWFAAPTLLAGSQEPQPSTTVVGLQEREGLPIDPHDYSEWLVQRLAWSVGPPLLLAALAGLVVGARRIVARAELAPLVLAAVVTTAAYATVSAITPDMPWALRRMFVAVIPAAALAAAVGAAVILPASRLLRAGAAGLLVLGAVGTSVPVVAERERDGTLAAMSALCDELPDDAVVYVADGPLGQWVRPLSATCDVPAARGVTDVPTEDLRMLAAAVESEGGRLVVVSHRPTLSADPAAAGSAPTGGGPVPGELVAQYTERRIERTIGRPPRYVQQLPREVWVYEVDARAAGATALGTERRAASVG